MLNAGGHDNGGPPRQFQWINANGYPVLYATDGTTALQASAGDNDLRSVYDRMQFTGIPNGLPENAAYSQFLQQQQHHQHPGLGITSTVSSPSYMTAIPAASLVPVNSVNYTTANSTTTTFANLGGGGAAQGGVIGGVVPVPKMPYTTATLGRPPPRHPGLKGTEPSICAQVRFVRGCLVAPGSIYSSTSSRVTSGDCGCWSVGWNGVELNKER